MAARLRPGARVGNVVVRSTIAAVAIKWSPVGEDLTGHLRQSARHAEKRHQAIFAATSLQFHHTTSCCSSNDGIILQEQLPHTYRDVQGLAHLAAGFSGEEDHVQRAEWDWNSDTAEDRLQYERDEKATDQTVERMRLQPVGDLAQQHAATEPSAGA